MSRTTRTFVALLVVALFCGRALGDAAFDRWYTLLLQDQRAGWAHVTVTEQAGRISSDSDMHISIKRGAMAMSLRVTSRFVETADGKPVEATMVQSLGATQAMKQTMRFGAEGIEVTTEQAGRVQTQKHPLPGEAWLTPAAASRFAEAEYAKGAKEISFHTMDPSLGPKAVQTTLKIIGDADVEVMGKTVPAVLIHSTVSAVPGVVMKQYVDAKLQPVKMTVSLMPGMELTMVESDELLAKAKLDAPEMLVRTLVKPDKPIARPRDLRRAVYRLTAAQQLPKLPVAGVQRQAEAGEGDPGSLIEVDLDQSLPVAKDDAPTDDHRRASPMLDSDDVKVRELTAEALKGLKPDAPVRDRAEALRAFVHRYVKAKDLSVGFATASEVARTRQGDCTEHAMLLAAMLRAAGISSRTVTGLIYIDEFVGQRGVFGYHMWTQAWVQDDAAPRGTWLDLDATLRDRAFDAAHIALATSPLADAALVNDLVAMMPLLGQLTIEVIEP